ncbi:MAG: efflux RND transporter periplasmic adaptor subunit, partial [Congregibacter sp.]|nr:efflux RND transporter periplasmic adaptor subunit [Congregibacter sp.]
MLPCSRSLSFAFTAILGLQLSACGDNTTTALNDERQERNAVPVVVETVQLKERQTRIEAVGTARAHKSVSLFAEVAGEVVAVNFQPGDRVEQGAVLL